MGLPSSPFAQRERYAEPSSVFQMSMDQPDQLRLKLPSIDEGVSSLQVRRHALESLKREVVNRVNNQSIEHTFLTGLHTNITQTVSPRNNVSPRANISPQNLTTLPASPRNFSAAISVDLV